MDSYSQSLCAEIKKSFLGHFVADRSFFVLPVAHINLINSSCGNLCYFCVLPKRINNTKTPPTPPNSNSSAIYIFTVNNLLYNQVRYFSVLGANRII